MITIDRSSKITITRQIYNQISDAILNGQLKPGDALPPTRGLALELRVSRNVVIDAYEQLLAEGFLLGKKGSGTYVADGATFNFPPQNPLNVYPLYHDSSFSGIDFRPGLPNLSMFPRIKWGQIAKKEYVDVKHNVFGYGEPEGQLKLRTMIRDYLFKERGVKCHPNQIIITSGATQALMLVTELLLNSEKIAVTEDPLTKEIQTIFQKFNSTIYPIPVDEKGLIADFLPLHIQPNLIYVTPSHQFPVGGVLPIQRRIQLIEYARKKDCFIVEDDYDSEFRYEGLPINSLQGLAPDHVIYIGTFSKVLSPSLRIGYIIVPEKLVNSFREIKRLYDLHTSSMEQNILATYIQEGHFERHILKMKKHYKQKRDYLIRLLKNEFQQIHITGTSTGLHLNVEFPNLIIDDTLINRFLINGIKLYLIRTHVIKDHSYNNHLIIGYGNVSTEEIEIGVTKMKHTIREHKGF